MPLDQRPKKNGKFSWDMATSTVSPIWHKEVLVNSRGLRRTTIPLGIARTRQWISHFHAHISNGLGYIYIIIHIHWLVVDLPSEESESQLGRIIPYIMEKIKHVPNHQPVFIYIYRSNQLSSDRIEAMVFAQLLPRALKAGAGQQHLELEGWGKTSSTCWTCWHLLGGQAVYY